MNNTKVEFERTFTVEEANATLPLVRAICQDLSSLSSEVIERKERLSVLLAGRDENRDDLYRQELLQIEEELERDTQRIDEFVQELRDLGVEPKGGSEGLVNFPSMMDGRVVFLSWKLDDAEVLYWHEIEEGFTERLSRVERGNPLMVGVVVRSLGTRGDGVSGALNHNDSIRCWYLVSGVGPLRIEGCSNRCESF